MCCMRGIFLKLQEASVARAKVNEEKVVGDDLRQVGRGVQPHSLVSCQLSYWLWCLLQGGRPLEDFEQSCNRICFKRISSASVKI